ncbi:unnamed protein product [Timema podura]|uniref:Fatty acyl-CoA reductase C-terminal domain-containing protein n=1 Tax=Timema podura TaxID=61482 RepID=A0ABN7NZ08_TIMPD|nr:unnamed protein product [Timema podura]
MTRPGKEDAGFLIQSDDIAVYNCCTGLQNPITWKQFVDYSFHHIRRHPLVDTMWYPDGATHSCSTINTVCTFFLHFLPAHIVDFFTVIAGKKPFMVSIQKKLSTAAVCLHYFTTQQWIFNDDKVRQLSSLLSAEDKKCFSFDVREIDWPTYIESYILGMRQFLFKEKPSSLPTARKKLRTLLWMSRFFKLVMLVSFCRILIAHSTVARRIFFTLLDLAFRVFRMIRQV